MPIPEFDQRGCLPAGIHLTIWEEVKVRFGTNSHRQTLLAGLEKALENLAEAGCRTLYLNGSFITNKPFPGDYDACWEDQGVDLDILDPVLLDFRDQRAAQKSKFGGELFIAQWEADWEGTAFLDYFQRDRNGIPKGILQLNLEQPQ